MPNCDDCDLIERLGDRILSERDCKELLEIVESNRDYHERNRERKTGILEYSTYTNPYGGD